MTYLLEVQLNGVVIECSSMALHMNILECTRIYPLGQAECLPLFVFVLTYLIALCRDNKASLLRSHLSITILILVAEGRSQTQQRQATKSIKHA